jgi:hypothetical protein
VDRLRARWQVLLVVTLVALVAIRVLEPHYVDLQLADDADAFRAAITAPGRAMAAAVADMVFAIGYGLLGIIGFRAHGGGARWATVGVIAVAVGALADVVENAFVFANALRHNDLTDGSIDAMRAVGAVKWIASVAVLVLLVLLLVRLLRRRAGT